MLAKIQSLPVHVCRCCCPHTLTSPLAGCQPSDPHRPIKQARDDKGSAAAIQEEMKDVPPLAMMAGEIKDEVYDDEDDTLDAGMCGQACMHAAWAYSTCCIVKPCLRLRSGRNVHACACLKLLLPLLRLHLCAADFKAEAISGDTKVLNESGKEIPLPKK